MKSKIIQFLVNDNDKNGFICEMSNWEGRIYKISRNTFNSFDLKSEINKVGIYFLFGLDKNFNETIYIGEAENVLIRIKQHLKDVNDWSECIFITSKVDSFNKAYVKYLENYFYDLAIRSKRSIIINRNYPTKSNVSEFEEVKLREIIDNILLIIKLLRYKTFEIIDNPKINKNTVIFEINAARGAKGKGYLVPEGFIVMKNSIISTDTVPSMSSSLINLRNFTIQQGIVNEQGMFTSDYLFTSPSLAAAVVMGRNANGRSEWKTKNGISLAKYQERNDQKMVLSTD